MPDDAKNAFGIGPIQLSTKYAILQTRQTVREAIGRIEALQQSVSATKQQVSKSVAEIEVALANQEASASSVRDVDKALSVVNELGGLILSDPVKALSSVGGLEQSSAQKLLE